MGEKPVLRGGDGEAATRSGRRHKLEFLSDMIVGIDLLAVLVASSVVTTSVNSMGQENAWLSSLSASKAAVGTLGAFYSFALVFRTNICYARWWEGRTLWGTVIVCSIRIVQQGRVWIEDEALLRRLGCLAIAFAYACKAHLRGNAIEDDEEDGAKLVLKGVMSKEELDLMASQATWQPYYCIDAMRAVVDEGLRKADGGRSPEWRKIAAQQALEDTISTLSSSIGGCIRVQSTGLPVSYDDILFAMGGIFLTVACVAWAPDLGLYNPGIVLIIYVVAKMIVLLGNDMEDPFGLDPSDLPLESFCATVEKQINAIDERSDMMKWNLAYGPSDTTLNESYRTYSTISLASTRTPSPQSDDDGIKIGQMLETDPLLV